MAQGPELCRVQRLLCLRGLSERHTQPGTPPPVRPRGRLLRRGFLKKDWEGKGGFGGEKAPRRFLSGKCCFAGLFLKRVSQLGWGSWGGGCAGTESGPKDSGPCLGRVWAWSAAPEAVNRQAPPCGWHRALAWALGAPDQPLCPSKGSAGPRSSSFAPGLTGWDRAPSPHARYSR